MEPLLPLLLGIDLPTDMARHHTSAIKPVAYTSCGCTCIGAGGVFSSLEHSIRSPLRRRSIKTKNKTKKEKSELGQAHRSWGRRPKYPALPQATYRIPPEVIDTKYTTQKPLESGPISAIAISGNCVHFVFTA
jgi:hypothetical protein